MEGVIFFFSFFLWLYSKELAPTNDWGRQRDPGLEQRYIFKIQISVQFRDLLGTPYLLIDQLHATAPIVNSTYILQYYRHVKKGKRGRKKYQKNPAE
jgi:hypothetical protein